MVYINKMPSKKGKESDFYNENIPFNEVLVITDDGEKLGILKRAQALREADRKSTRLNSSH